MAKHIEWEGHKNTKICDAIASLLNAWADEMTQ